MQFDVLNTNRDLLSNEVVTSDDLTSPFGLLVIRPFGHLWRVHARARRVDTEEFRNSVEIGMKMLLSWC